MTGIFEAIKETGIIPVVKINDWTKAAELAETLVKTGIMAVEITFRSAAAEESIKEISRAVPEITVLAGTILNTENAERAVENGASAVISPGTNEDTVKWCLDNKVPVIPGCMTPTEIQKCINYNINIVKFFPAEAAGGVKMLEAFKGPFGSVSFMPTGGINQSNLINYMSLSNVIACGGSWMVTESLIDSGNFDEITRLSKEAVKILKPTGGKA